MSRSLLIDTHIVIWLEEKSDRLRPSTKRLIDECWRNGGTIFVSAVTAWEIANLVATGRMDLDLPVDEWIDRFLDQPDMEAVALSHRAAARSYEISEFDRRDPGDRLLIATSIDLGCPLVTYDTRITAFAEAAGQSHGFTVAS